MGRLKALGSFLIEVGLLVAISLALYASPLQAQSQTPVTGIPQKLLAKAKAGDADAQFSLGWLYDQGQGVTQDYAQAAAWYRKAAEQGDASAQFNLGSLYRQGRGVPQDYAQATAWYRRAAEQGLARAQYNLGVAYDNGQGVTQDYAQAATWWHKAAEQGAANAQYNLGLLYDNGQGVTQDYAQAATWYRKAAEQGVANAQYNLALFCDQGQGVPQDYAQAAVWYRKAAEQGLANAQNNLGLLYHQGQGMPQDYAQAAAWFRKAAEQGLANAQFNLGSLYHQGQGVAQDYAQAAAWYRKAVEQGFANAQNNLGSLYRHGQGVPQDYAQAAAWYRRAAEQGLATAQSNLGDMYYLGQGVGQDDAEAVAWYRKAADNGSTKAKAILPLLSEKTVIAASSANRGVAGNLARTALSPQAIAKRASESTVLIVSTDRSGKGVYVYFGSGFAIEPNLIVTNSHVFQDGRLGLVRKIGSDRVPHIIEKVVLRDKENDIVLLYVPDLDLPSLPIQPSEPVIGDTVFTMGNPKGMEGTFSEGLVSALREERGVRMIQITAPISHGSSGGPVFNIYGEVIGISTSTLSSGQSLNFAVPASAIDALLQRANPNN